MWQFSPLDGSFATTPTVTTPCSVAAKALMVAFDRPSATRLIGGGGPLGYSPPPGAPHLTVPMAGAGGGGGSSSPLAIPVVVYWGRGGVMRATPRVRT